MSKVSIETKVEQMTIFDEILIQDKETHGQVFEIGDKVKVKDFKEMDFKMSIEDAYVLSAFSGKKGKVVGIHYGKVTTYEVELNSGDKTYFYSWELILLG